MIAAVVAALIVASNINRRVTGLAFVPFVSSSLALLSWGFLGRDASGIGWQNACLLLINAWGVWRHLIRAPGATQPDARATDRSPTVAAPPVTAGE